MIAIMSLMNGKVESLVPRLSVAASFVMAILLAVESPKFSVLRKYTGMQVRVRPIEHVLLASDQPEDRSVHYIVGIEFLYKRICLMPSVYRFEVV